MIEQEAALRNEIEALRAQVDGLHRSLWLVVRSSGGLCAIPAGLIENFDPTRAKLKTWVDLPTGQYIFEAL